MEIHCKDVVANVTQTVIVLKLKNVYNSNVWLPAEKEVRICPFYRLSPLIKPRKDKLRIKKWPIEYS